MLPEALRPVTAKAAAAAQGKLAPGCRPARRTAASGWPSWPALTTPPGPAHPGDVISTPAQKRRKNQRGRKAEGQAEAAGAAGAGKAVDRLGHRRHPAVIAAAFDEAERRDLQHKREWGVLVDGNNTQIET